jgi:tRNA-specific 2-thiouridylase
MKEAKERGAECIATGHYARIEPGEGEKQKTLKKGIDQRKDQSYVLYVLKQEVLKKLVLPLGNHKKNAVKKIAHRLNLPASASIESQEICFIEDKQYFKFIEKSSSYTGKSGSIKHIDGDLLGSHKGIYAYTIGQRKGLGISSPEPLYAANIDIAKNTIYVGPREAAQKKMFFVKELHWINHHHISLKKGDQGYYFRAHVKVRSTMNDVPATVYLEALAASPLFTTGRNKRLSAKTVRVVFDEPQWAPAPGQSQFNNIFFI